LARRIFLLRTLAGSVYDSRRRPESDSVFPPVSAQSRPVPSQFTQPCVLAASRSIHRRHRTSRNPSLAATARKGSSVTRGRYLISGRRSGTNFTGAGASLLPAHACSFFAHIEQRNSLSGVVLQPIERSSGQSSAEAVCPHFAHVHCIVPSRAARRMPRSERLARQDGGEALTTTCASPVTHRPSADGRSASSRAHRVDSCFSNLRSLLLMARFTRH